MSKRIKLSLVVLLGFAWSLSPAVFAQSGESQPEAEEAYEALLRGPVHEGFAEQYNSDPQPGLVVPRQPPEPVEELPPEVKPEGDNVIWLDGYWAWEDEREDFVWLSGIWRQVPPGMRWLPGYWIETDGGWQWISGTWIDETVDEVEYLPEPPQTLELGPVGAPPSEQHLWIPGTWLYQTNRYVWRPGHWSVGYTNRVWVPARYVWTPRGCIYVGGYWDYPLVDRGHLFAPVYFHRPVYTTAGFCYTPSVYVSVSLLIDHFWVRPGYCHYYFGDYYGPRYSSWGLYPWFRFPLVHRRVHDPLYSYYRHRHWSSWHDHHHRWSSRHDWYTRHSDWRPPHTWHQQTIVQKNIVNIDARQYNRTEITNINNILLGRSLNDVAGRRDEDRRMVHIDQQQRERYRQDFDRTRQIVEDRRRVEGGPPLDLADRRGSLRLPIPADWGRTIGQGAEHREGRSRWTDLSSEGRGGPSERPDPSSLLERLNRGGPPEAPGRGGPPERPDPGSLLERLNRGGPPEAPGRGGPPERPDPGSLLERLNRGGPPEATGRGGPSERPDPGSLLERLNRGGPPEAPGRGGPSREQGQGGPPSGQERAWSLVYPGFDRKPGAGDPGRPAGGERNGESALREMLRPSIPLPDAPGATLPRRPDVLERLGPSGDLGQETAPNRSRSFRSMFDRAAPSNSSSAIPFDRSPERPTPSFRQIVPPDSRPAPSVSRPAPSFSRPAPSIGRPAPSISRPAPSISRPAPSIGRPAPSISRPAPSISRPAPSVSRPAPSISRPAPSISRPAPSVSRPAPSISRPEPSISRQAPSVSRPAPSITRPAPSFSRPAPSISRPAPSISRREPSVTRPAPSISRPAPSASRATPSRSRGAGRSARDGR